MGASDPQKPTVRHRIDGLETNAKSPVGALGVRHRIDGLETQDF